MNQRAESKFTGTIELENLVVHKTKTGLDNEMNLTISNIFVTLNYSIMRQKCLLYSTQHIQISKFSGKMG